jgi:hypothetical protein
MTSIGEDAFAFNQLESVELPASLTTMTTATSVDLAGGSLGPANNLTVSYPLAFESTGFTAGTWKGYASEAFVTVNFDLAGHGDVEAPRRITPGQLLTKPAVDTTATGFTFTGWFADAALATTFNGAARRSRNRRSHRHRAVCVRRPARRRICDPRTPAHPKSLILRWRARRQPPQVAAAGTPNRAFLPARRASPSRLGRHCDEGATHDVPAHRS